MEKSPYLHAPFFNIGLFTLVHLETKLPFNLQEIEGGLEQILARLAGAICSTTHEAEACVLGGYNG